jgi:hypothetical protein
MVEPKDRLQLLMTYMLILIVSTFLLKYIWNQSLVKHISVLKPVNSMRDALALSVGLMIIRGC